MTDHTDVEQVLFDNLGALPSEEFTHINLMPFAVDSDATNAFKREVAKGIVTVLANGGFLRDRDKPEQSDTLRDVTVNCRMCSTPLFNLMVDGGVAAVPAASVIAAVSRLSSECPHKVTTPDDQRRLIEEAVLASQGEQQ